MFRSRVRRNRGPAVDVEVVREDAEWRRLLTPAQYRVLRRAGTEAAFTGAYWDEHAAGTYRCAGCGAELFTSDVKFDSGTGWPSFTEPVDDAAVILHRDIGLLGFRTEVRCRACDSHLGHVFGDGPRAAGGKRYCVNSCALDLDLDTTGDPPHPT